jgi:hypothetical protein
MISVFYLVGEAKQKQMMLKLEEEKNKALIEEKLRSENTIRKNLESERKRFAEEERLRINEQIRLKAELEAAKLKQEQERKMYEDAEKEKMKLFHESKFIKQVLQPPSKAEIHKEAETIKNEFDHKILDEVNSNLTNLNLGGIENFTNIDKIAKEYTSGVLIPDEDLSEDSIENEMNNTFLNTLKNDEINENYEKNIEKNNINEEIPEPVSAEIETERKVSGKSFSILKQMLKDG